MGTRKTKQASNLFITGWVVKVKLVFIPDDKSI